MLSRGCGAANKRALGAAERFTPTDGYKSLFRRLRSSFRPAKLVDALTAASLEEVSVLVLGAPREPFSEEEFKTMKEFITRGGALLLLLTEGGEGRLGTNVNYLLEKFNISVNADCVLRTVHQKYMHPKEVCSLSSENPLQRSLPACATLRVARPAHLTDAVSPRRQPPLPSPLASPPQRGACRCALRRRWAPVENTGAYRRWPSSAGYSRGPGPPGGGGRGRRRRHSQRPARASIGLPLWHAPIQTLPTVRLLLLRRSGLRRRVDGCSKAKPVYTEQHEHFSLRSLS